jgi:hypothetical protein
MRNVPPGIWIMLEALSGAGSTRLISWRNIAISPALRRYWQ